MANKENNNIFDSRYFFDILCIFLFGDIFFDMRWYSRLSLSGDIFFEIFVFSVWRYFFDILWDLLFCGIFPVLLLLFIKNLEKNWHYFSSDWRYLLWYSLYFSVLAVFFWYSLRFVLITFRVWKYNFTTINKILAIHVYSGIIKTIKKNMLNSLEIALSRS